MELAPLRRKVEGFRARESAAGALSRALLAGEKLALRSVLALAQDRLAAAQDEALAELRTLDAAWPAPDPAALENLAALQARFAFLAKWTAQLREDVFQLRA